MTELNWTTQSMEFSSQNARIPEWVVIPFSRGSFQPRNVPGSSALQADSLPAEPPVKPPIYNIKALNIDDYFKQFMLIIMFHYYCNF